MKNNTVFENCNYDCGNEADGMCLGVGHCDYNKNRRQQIADRQLSKEECLEIGGHCYEMCDVVIATNPPTYHRICKHCGHVQEGRSQPNMKWEDDK